MLDKRVLCVSGSVLLFSMQCIGTNASLPKNLLALNELTVYEETVLSLVWLLASFQAHSCHVD